MRLSEMGGMHSHQSWSLLRYVTILALHHCTEICRDIAIKLPQQCEHVFNTRCTAKHALHAYWMRFAIVCRLIVRATDIVDVSSTGYRTAAV